MLKTKIRVRAVTTLLVAFLFAASVPAFAQHGGDSQESQAPNQASSETTVTESHSAGGGSSSTTLRRSGEVGQSSQTETETHNGVTEDGQAELHRKGDDLVAELHKDHKPKSAADVQKLCQTHKQGLTTKFNAISTNSQRIQTKIDGILGQAQTYQQTNNLSVANYASLLAAAQSAQSASAAAIAALKAVTPTLDCNSTTVASDVATFKTAAQDVRTKLTAYRSAVRALLQALEAAKEPASQGATQ